MSARAQRSTAGKEVLSASERLMAGLLIEEERCFAELAAGLGVIAKECADRTLARFKAAGKRGVVDGAVGLFPTAERLRTVLMPPVGTLLATTRERSLTVAARQMRACASTVEPRYRALANEATKSARLHAAPLEKVWYERVRDGLDDAAFSMGVAMLDQLTAWNASREETVAQLVARWTSMEEVRLPGSQNRGAVWALQPRMTTATRNASVALTNGLLIAAMRGWNDAARPEPVAV